MRESTLFNVIWRIFRPSKKRQSISSSEPIGLTSYSATGVYSAHFHLIRMDELNPTTSRNRHIERVQALPTEDRRRLRRKLRRPPRPHNPSPPASPANRIAEQDKRRPNRRHQLVPPLFLSRAQLRSPRLAQTPEEPLRRRDLALRPLETR